MKSAGWFNRYSGMSSNSSTVFCINNNPSGHDGKRSEIDRRLHILFMHFDAESRLVRDIKYVLVSRPIDSCNKYHDWPAVFVRCAKRAMLARISSAVFVHTNGLGSSL